MRSIILLSIVFSLLPGMALKAQETSSMQELIGSGNFRFTADRAFPSGGGSIDMISRPNKVEIRDGNAQGDLAYFGQARNIGYDADGGGIKFDGEMTNTSMKVKERKNLVNYSFSVKGTRDQFNCYLTVSPDGSGTLSVSSNLRNTISYQGRISPMEKEIP